MSISSILSNGMLSMQSSMNRTAIAGSRLNVENEQFAASMVAMAQGASDAKMAANVIQTGDQLLGTLIDIRG